MTIDTFELNKFDVLGVNISAITVQQALATINRWIVQDKRHHVSVCTVHTVMECQKSLKMRMAVNEAGLATPDGMPLVWLGKIQSQAAIERVYGPDLMLALCKLSTGRGYRHYFYGGAAGVPEKLAEVLCERYPGLSVAGGYSPPFRALTAEEDEEIVQRINDSRADIVWVGLGTPKQDLWMASHRDRLDAPVLIGVGAAFDFHTGQISQAPRWMQQVGLEWFFRLMQEPGRLWYRYLVYNPWFVLLVIIQALRLKLEFPSAKK